MSGRPGRSGGANRLSANEAWLRGRRSSRPGLRAVPPPAAGAQSTPARRRSPWLKLTHLTAVSRKLVREILNQFDFERAPHKLRLLVLAAEANDRIERARQLLEQAGGPLTTSVRRGAGARLHPAARLLDQERKAFTKLITALELED